MEEMFYTVAHVNSDGNINKDTKLLIGEFLKKVKNKSIQFRITEIEQDKSLDKVGYYMGQVVKDIQQFLLECDGVKYTPNEVHELNIKIYGKKPVVKTINGKEVYTLEYIRTSKMSDKQYYHFIDDIIKHWRGKGLEIKKPIKPNKL